MSRCRLLADMNISPQTVADLCRLGWDTVRVNQILSATATDREIIEQAIVDNRVVLTQDLDFSDTRKFSPGTHCGILLLRLKNPSATAIKALLKELVSHHQFKEWHGCVVVATQRKVRVFKPSF